MRRKIKSIVLSSDHEALFQGDDGEILRRRVTGFAVARCCEAGERFDEVEPFICDCLGTDFCSDSQNYLGTVRAGEEFLR